MRTIDDEFDETYSQGGVVKSHDFSRLVRAKCKVIVPHRFSQDVTCCFRDVLFQFERQHYRPSIHGVARALLNALLQFPLVEEGRLREFEGRYAKSYRKHRASNVKMLVFESDKQYGLKEAESSED
jgi:hypothetical protein